MLKSYPLNPGTDNNIRKFLSNNNRETRLIIDAQGATLYTPGDGYKYYVFTSPGSITVSADTVGDFLVVGGGGAGGENSGGGGGGGGAVVYQPATITVGTYNVIVGAGGTGLVSPYSPYPLPGSPGPTPNPNTDWRGYPGQQSSIVGFITAPGGNAAIAGYSPAGGGGGGGAGGSPGGGAGGNGPQPFRNGPGNPGSDGTQVPVFAGIGAISPPGYFGGGGGGGAWDGPSGPWPGGAGGGGPSGSTANNSGTDGTANTGGGGGGVLDPTSAPTAPRKGGDGGSGVIMFRVSV